MIVVVLIIKSYSVGIFIPTSSTQPTKVTYFTKLLLPCLKVVLNLVTTVHNAKFLLESLCTPIVVNHLEDG